MVGASGIDIVTLLLILALAWTSGLGAQRPGEVALLGELVRPDDSADVPH